MHTEATATPTTLRRNAPAVPVEYASDKQLAQRYAVSRGTIWRWSHEGHIPRPRKLGGNTSRWNLSDVIAALGA